jgi:hypothetical protein
MAEHPAPISRREVPVGERPAGHSPRRSSGVVPSTDGVGPTGVTAMSGLALQLTEVGQAEHGWWRSRSRVAGHRRWESRIRR